MYAIFSNIYLRFIYAFFILFHFFSCIGKDDFRNNEPPAIKGVLDLRKWDFEKQGKVNLYGEWEFYWGRLFTPKDLDSNNFPIAPTYINVPFPWNGFQNKDNGFTGEGYATYRLKIKLNQKKIPLGIYIVQCNTAYKLWVDNELVATNGKVSAIPNIMEPQYYPSVVNFLPSKETVYLTIQVTNFYHSKGGIETPIRLGHVPNIQQYRERRIAYDLFFGTGLLILGFYHIIFYFIRKRELPLLYSSLFCFFASIRTLFKGDKLWVSIFPNFDWSTYLQIEYSSYYLTFLFFILFLFSCFPRDKSGLMQDLSKITAIVFVFLTIFTQSVFFTGIVILFHIISIFIILYLLYFFIKLIHKERRTALRLSIASLFFIIGYLGDVLNSNSIIFENIYFSIGLFIFGLLQFFHFSIGFSKEYFFIRKNINNLSLREKIRQYLEIDLYHEILNSLTSMIDIKKDTDNENKNLYTLNIQRLMGVIHNLIYYRKTPKENKLNKSIVDFKMIIEQTIPIFEPLLSGKDVVIINHVEKESLIYADEQKIKQIFFNLLDNSVKFTKKGKIEIFFYKKENFNTIKLVDTGIGIPEKMQNLVFAPFLQSDSDIYSKYGGTGQGLGVAKSLVELHGGQIRLSSQIGLGTEILFTIPIESDDLFGKPIQLQDQEKPNSPILENSKNNERELEANQKNETVLLVESHPIYLSSMFHILEDNGYQVIKTSVATEAIGIVQENAIDLMIIEMQMPEISGLEVCKIIRNSHSSQKLPILLLSYELEKQLPTFFEFGVNDYLRKPFAREEFLARVKNLIKIKRNVNESQNFDNTTNISDDHSIFEELLIKEFPKIKSLSFEKKHLIRNAMGGDFYHFVPINENEIGIFMIDIAGEGAYNPMIFGMIKLAINLDEENIKNPSALIQNLNRHLYKLVEKGYITVSYIYINTKYKQITFSGVGYPPLLIWKNKSNTFKEYETFKGVLGVFENLSPINHIVQLEEQDKIIMHSDGIYKIRNSKGNYYSNLDFQNFLTQNKHLKNSTLLDEFGKELYNWKDEKENQTILHDDILILFINYL